MAHLFRDRVEWSAEPPRYNRATVRSVLSPASATIHRRARWGLIMATDAANAPLFAAKTPYLRCPRRDTLSPDNAACATNAGTT